MLNIKPKKNAKTADKILETRKGAVFILAFFKKAILCIITDSPPNEHKKQDSGKLKLFIPLSDNSLSPLVHSKSPKVKAFPLSLNGKENKFIKGDKTPKDSNTSIKR